MSGDMRLPLLKSALTTLVGVVEIAINEIAFLEEDEVDEIGDEFAVIFVEVDGGSREDSYQYLDDVLTEAVDSARRMLRLVETMGDGS